MDESKTSNTAASATSDAPPESWAILEQLGHRRLAGRVSEVEMFGVKMGRIDIPQANGTMMTKFFGGGSVYSMTIVNEEAARAVALRLHVAPVEPWEMPKALPPATQPTFFADDLTDGPDDTDRNGY